MKSYIALGLLVLATIMGCTKTEDNQDAPQSRQEAPLPAQAETPAPTDPSIYDFTLAGIDGEPVSLETYRDQVLLIVNVASKCGATPQYAQLQDIYERYKDRGFFVLGFPANNFGKQEPGSNEEIKAFCTTKYQVTFPMFAKISVKGADIHPLYQFLTDKQTNPEYAGVITWNFNKFLIGPDGGIVNRFPTQTKPDDPKVIEAIEQTLGKN